MIKRLCLYPGCSCFRLDGSNYCERHQEYGEQKAAKHIAFLNALRSNEEFYRTKRWRTLRAKIIKEQKHCQCCGTKDNLTVDHIIDPRGDEQLFFDESNLQVLCEACHRRKTACEIAERKKQK